MRVENYQGPGWVRKSGQDQMQAILEHPRLVFDQIGPEEQDIIRYFLANESNLTVVIR